MAPSALSEGRKVPEEARLRVLRHSAEGGESPGEEDRASQVDGAGQTKQGKYIGATVHYYITITRNHILGQSYKLRSRPLVFSRWSWD